MIQSSKTLAITSQIAEWIAADSKVKIIIFTLFHLMIEILARIFNEKKWSYVKYTGKMSQSARQKAIQTFGKSATVLLCGLRCSCEGLNLKMATKVILLEGWWNKPVENQGMTVHLSGYLTTDVYTSSLLPDFQVRTRARDPMRQNGHEEFCGREAGSHG